MSEIKEKLLNITKLRNKMTPLLLANMQDMIKVNDPVLQILKCHLVTEALLDSLIEFAFEPNGAAILSAKLKYSTKVQILSNTFLVNDIKMLPDFVVGSLRKLNQLRNRMAHQLGATVSVTEIMDLFAGVDYLMPITPSDENITVVIFHYTGFIFGNLLPKYETIDSD